MKKGHRVTPPSKINFGEIKHRVSELPPDTVRKNIDVINFDAVKFKLRNYEHGLGWNEEKTNRVELMYRRFLFLQTTSPETVVPTNDIDQFWHQHILDTQKYPTDCQKAFGFYLHHFPYFGLRGEDDNRNLQWAFERSGTLYESMYGEAYATVPSAPISSPAITVINSSDDDKCAGCG